ncbi:hypothetical protein ACP70R_021254 [Stipagrostis hirtigluma subsp. patula]
MASPVSPSPAGAANVGAPSSSAVAGGTASGHCLLDIEATKELPTGQYIKSRPFSAGGRSWHIQYYPNGKRADCAKYVSVFLYLDGDEGGVTEPAAAPAARAQFSLLDQAGKPVPSLTVTTSLHRYSSLGYGYSRFIRRSYLAERSEDPKGGRFAIRCDVVVVPTKEPHAEEEEEEETAAASPRFVAVPPSDLHRSLGGLLATKEGADVTFQVAGEMFSAHRYVLAARSTVFRAELFGPMKEGTNAAEAIRVDDMEADVFRALLGFVYTDTFPDDKAMEQQEEAAMAQHLLVAADRYNLGRLKLICEDKLCKHIDTDSAATILALAEQHHCRGLKEACFRFLSFPLNLNGVMATDGYDHLTRSCPTVLEELMSRFAAHRLVGDGTQGKEE